MQANRLTPQLLQKKAVVYIRQSTLEQVQSNLESQRRQYQLADHARRLGFAEVVVLDDDLGRSGSGYVERPGFVKLIELICTGEVGAVFALEASRLARNGRDWHHIVELCGFYGVILVDGEGSYDPTQYNDRLLLGLKGSLSEFELGLLRQRLMEAIFQKAQRGELRFAVPMGYSWPPDSAIEFEPDRRVKETIELVFRQFREFGSARQLLLHWRKQQLQFPTPSCVGGRQLSFGPPTYRQIISVLKNPFYAGAYVYGKSEARIEMVNGRPRKVYGYDKPINRWSVVIRDHHPAYITWEQYERNQVLLAENAFQRSTQGRKSGRGGSALLTGLLRCRRCGRMLGVGYSGAGRLLRYSCRGGQLNRGAPPCLTFGGLDVDRVVSQELLRAVQPMAVEASFRAEKLMSEQREAASAWSNGSGSRHNTKPPWPPGDTRPLTPPIVWSQPSWRSGGMRLWYGFGSWKNAWSKDRPSPPAFQHLVSWRDLQPTCRPCGRIRGSRVDCANGWCALQSTRSWWTSTTRLDRSCWSSIGREGGIPSDG